MKLIFLPCTYSGESNRNLISCEFGGNNHIEIDPENGGLCDMWIIDCERHDSYRIIRAPLDRCEALFDAMHKAYEDGAKIFDVRKYEENIQMKIFEAEMVKEYEEACEREMRDYELRNEE